MVIWILAAGIGAGYVAEKVYQPKQVDASETKKARSSWDDVEKLADEGEWAQVLWKIPKHVLRRFEYRGPLVLAGLACLCWLVFLWQAVDMPGWFDLRLWCMPLAILLGVISLWPTHFFDLWQERVWNLRDSSELIPGLRYYILGVGAREEVAKLLCLLPLMPILLRIRSEFVALIISGSVGLGFAFAENIGYFAASQGTAAMGRFLMANPFHVALTGLAGLMLYRTLRNPYAWWSHALGVFGILIFAHGLYDAFIALPALREYALLTTIIFALTMYRFFS